MTFLLALLPFKGTFRDLSHGTDPNVQPSFSIYLTVCTFKLKIINPELSLSLLFHCAP